VFGPGCENRLTSVCDSSTIHGRRLLSFACPKESNQRKRHPRGRGLPGIHARQTTQGHGGLRREHIRVLSSKWPASCRPPLRGFSSESLPRPRGTPGRGGARQSLPQKHRIYPTSDISDTSVLFFFPSFALLFGSPLSSGGGWTDQPREARAARGIAPIRTTGHGWPVGRTRPLVANPQRS